MTLRRSTRNADFVRDRLTGWLTAVLPPGAAPQVTLHGGADANGMSSETIPLSVTHTAGGARRIDEYVARIAPAPADLPVFPSYRVRDQYDVMRLVARHSTVPVPEVGLIEETGAVLGTPFFLMDRVEGLIPPDVLPGWGLFEHAVLGRHDPSGFRDWFDLAP
jgi:aminoglycoside phosphotransferase (APT) family kinase protein